MKLPTFALRLRTTSYLTLDCTLSMGDALSAGVAGVWLAIPTGSLRLTAASLIPNKARLTGTTPERALMTQKKPTQHSSDVSILVCSMIDVAGRWLKPALSAAFSNHESSIDE